LRSEQEALIACSSASASTLQCRSVELDGRVWPHHLEQNMSSSKSLSPQSIEPDVLAKRLFVLVMVAVFAYVGVILALMASAD
jgi:hypothetical protein